MTNTTHGLLLGLFGGSAGITEPAYFSLFRPSGTAVGVLRGYLQGGEYEYRLLMEIGGTRVVSYRLGNAAGFTVGNNSPAIRTVEVRHCVASYEQNNANVTYTGGNWLGPSVVAGVYGSGYRRNAVAGEYVEFTTPAGCTVVGFYSYYADNCGVVKVSIDGDATAANLLSTAQQLVDAGTLANTVLVANGGTLNPTDRVIDLYNATSANGVREIYNHLFLAEDLSAGAHTVRITVTGYKRAASSDVRLYFAGGTYGIPGTVTMSTPGAAVYYVGTITSADSQWDFVFNATPSGAGSAEWIGHVGTLKVLSLAISVDGADVGLLSNNQIAVGSSAVVSVTSRCYHSAGFPDIGTVTTTYTLSPTGGLTVDYALTWGVSATFGACYPAMFPMDDNTYDRARNVVDGVPSSVVTANADNGDSLLNADGNCAALWSQTGYWGGAFYVPSVSGVSKGATLLFLEDRGGGTINKWYFTRTSAGVAPGSVFAATIVYRLMFFPSGAEASLAV